MVSGDISVSLYPQGGAPGKLQLLFVPVSLLSNFKLEFIYLDV